MQKNILIAFGIFALCMVQSATAIKCYQCKSMTDPNCAKDHIDSNMGVRIVDCNMSPSPNAMEQYKPVTKCNRVVTKDNGGLIISRDCQFEQLNASPNVCSVSHSRDVSACDICTGDLCNNSSAGNFLAMGLAVIVAMVSMHFVM